MLNVKCIIVSNRHRNNYFKYQVKRKIAYNRHASNCQNLIKCGHDPNVENARF